MNRRLLVLVAGGLSACGAPSLIHRRPADRGVNHQVTAMWADEIRGSARDGDWILTRSYSAVGDLIVLGTWGESISHAAIYDAERGTVIEAVAGGVREVPLESLLHRNRVAIVVRPRGQSAVAGRAAVARARRIVGSEFDSWGLIGLPADDKFYCSELVAWASGVDAGSLVTPAELAELGEVVFLSGPRDDARVQRAAHERLRLASRRE